MWTRLHWLKWLIGFDRIYFAYAFHNNGFSNLTYFVITLFLLFSSIHSFERKRKNVDAIRRIALIKQYFMKEARYTMIDGFNLDGFVDWTFLRDKISDNGATGMVYSGKFVEW